MKTKGIRFTKKGVVMLSLLAALLIGAIYLNVQLNKQENEKSRTDAAKNAAVETGEAKTVNANVFSSYFTDFRDERNVIRSQEIDYLRMIINEETSDAETVKNAQERLMELVDNMEKEFAIESLIRSKGFLDAAVTFRNGSISIVIDGNSLSDEEVARILDIIKSETGAPASSVKISLSKGNV